MEPCFDYLHGIKTVAQECQWKVIIWAICHLEYASLKQFHK